MKRLLVPFTLVAFAGCVTLAHAATHKPYPLPKHAAHCRTHYRKFVIHHNGRRVVECEYVVVKVTRPIPQATTSLAVKLDPGYTVNPTNALDLTFTYSASATKGTALDPNLPEGVLEFYSDGLLECSTNVGGDIDGGTCEVVYSDYGDHTTNVIYDSGTNSVTTGPQTVNIPAPPMPALELAPLPTAAVVPIATAAVLGVDPTTPANGYQFDVTITDANGPVSPPAGSVKFEATKALQIGAEADPPDWVATTETNGQAECIIVFAPDSVTSPDCTVTEPGPFTVGLYQPDAPGDTLYVEFDGSSTDLGSMSNTVTYPLS
jgi:hypothetical protein